MRKLTFDRDRCLACRSCELACAVAHSASGALLPALDERPAPRRRVTLALGPRGIAALRCAQCDEPLCVFSCKSGALHRLLDGRLEFDESRCVGCLMCYMVCTLIGVRSKTAAFFTSPGVRSETAEFFTPGTAGAATLAHDVPVRCDVCADREMPACVEACPTKALAAGVLQIRNGVRHHFSGHVVVVGSSAAGIAACEAAREMAPDCRITLITADQQWYSRPLLPYLLARRIGCPTTTSAETTPGVISRDALAWRPQDHLAGLGVEVMAATHAVELRPNEKVLLVRPGLKAGTYDTKEISFDRLVVATGARATRLEVPGANLGGVFRLRDIEDLEGIDEQIRLPPSQTLRRASKPDPADGSPHVRAVVVGGGNVGLQATEALARRGVRVTVVVKSPHLLSQMVDAEAGRRVGELFARNGVEVRTGRDVAEIIPFDSPAASPPLAQGLASPASSGALARGRVGRVRLDNGEVIDADLVVVGKGIEPNVEWLRSSGVRIGRGVIVDRSGRTNVDGVLAAGDCAEVDDPIAGRSIVSGIWPIAYEMGRAAGAAAVGTERPSAGALRMNSSRFFGTPVIAIGEPRADRLAGATEHLVAENDDVYRKLVMKDGRLIGAVLVGDVTDAGLYYRMYRDGVALGETTADDLERTRSRWIAGLAEQLSV